MRLLEHGQINWRTQGHHLDAHDDHGNDNKGDFMIVPMAQLHHPIKTSMIPDKFIRDKMNKLYYYQWKPVDENQTTLFE